MVRIVQSIDSTDDRIGHPIPATPATPGAGVAVPGIPTAAVSVASADPAADTLVDAILTELGGFIRDLRCGSTERLVRGELSMTQLHVLWQLEHHGAMPMSRVAELLGISLSNATGLIDRMAERGLVERIRTDDDRRLVLIRPGTEGRQALAEAEVLKRERMRTVLQRLDPPQLRRVATALHDIRTAFAAELGTTGHVHHFVDTTD